MQQAEYDSTVVREKLLRHCSEFSRDYAGFLVVRAQLSFPVFKYPFSTNWTPCVCVCVCVCVYVCVCVCGYVWVWQVTEQWESLYVVMWLNEMVGQTVDC